MNLLASIISTLSLWCGNLPQPSSCMKTSLRCVEYQLWKESAHTGDSKSEPNTMSFTPVDQMILSCLPERSQIK